MESTEQALKAESEQEKWSKDPSQNPRPYRGVLAIHRKVSAIRLFRSSMIALFMIDSSSVGQAPPLPWRELVLKSKPCIAG